jgi:hypothetical protein
MLPIDHHIMMVGLVSNIITHAVARIIIIKDKEEEVEAVTEDVGIREEMLDLHIIIKDSSIIHRVIKDMVKHLNILQDNRAMVGQILIRTNNFMDNIRSNMISSSHTIHTWLLATLPQLQARRHTTISRFHPLTNPKPTISHSNISLSITSTPPSTQANSTTNPTCLLK